jgi:hypothetical protein
MTSRICLSSKADLQGYSQNTDKIKIYRELSCYEAEPMAGFIPGQISHYLLV